MDLSKPNLLTIFEYDTLVPNDLGAEGNNVVPREVFSWLESQCRQKSENQLSSRWIKVAQRGRHRAVQFTNYVGVIRTPSGFQIEVLPKIGKIDESNKDKVRQLLIEMLRCLKRFKHIQLDRAQVSARKMPIFEVFVLEFLRATQQIVKRGLRSDYITHQDNLFALRGKLLITQQIRSNMHRPDRFSTEHDLFSSNRPENRLIHTALLKVLSLSQSQDNQRLARELGFVFADIPTTTQIQQDFQRVRLDRGMSYYAEALDWARLILEDYSPLTGDGTHHAPSLLFPMEAVFEAYVAKHLERQLIEPFRLKPQSSKHYLIQHKENGMFQLKPDLLVQEKKRGQPEIDRVVLDTKWKLIDSQKSSGADKYGVSQSDFYQLYAYGHNYLDGRGDVVLIYPLTDSFKEPLPVFEFIKSPKLRIWVLPFCLECKRMVVPPDLEFYQYFESQSLSEHSVRCGI